MQKEDQKGFLAPHLLTTALGATILAYCFTAFSYGGPINSFFFLNTNLSDLSARYIEMSFATIALICSSSLFFQHMKGIRKFSLLICFLWIIAIALSKLFLHSSFAYELSLFTSSSRWILPISIIYLDKSSYRTAHFLLRVGLGLTFIGHGIEAILYHPLFMDYLFYALEIINSSWTSVSVVKNILLLIGIIDIIVGLMVILAPNKKVYGYLFLWGFLTALIRIPYHGQFGFLEFLLRTPHWLMPLCLIFWDVKIESIKEFFIFQERVKT